MNAALERAQAQIDIAMNRASQNRRGAACRHAFVAVRADNAAESG